MRVCIFGLGKIGYPLLCKVSEFYDTIGVDSNINLINELIKPNTYLFSEPGIEQSLSITKNRVFTSQLTYGADCYIIAVPLFNLFGYPDFSNIDDVIDSIAKYLKYNDLIILETTVPVGTTRNRILKRLNKLRPDLNENFNVVFSPERVQSGRYFDDLKNYPKIVGGVNTNSSRKAAKFYESVLVFDGIVSEVREVSSAEVAELSKISESIYRDVNIALANELQNVTNSLGIDFSELMLTANSQSQSHIHKAGIGVGGHCIPVYPYFLLKDFPDLELVRNARRINESRPHKVLEILDEVIRNNNDISVDSKIIILGVAYRPWINELTNSIGLEIAKSVSPFYPNIELYDPLIQPSYIKSLGFKPGSLNGNYKIMVVVTEYEEFKSISHLNFSDLRLIVDGRGVIDKENFPKALYYSLA
jgi:UDP-N-acetyl-D-glucosamine dehydrogenase